MGYNSPGMGIYYGVEADWVPQLPPRCEGRRVKRGEEEEEEEEEEVVKGNYGEERWAK